MAKCPIDRCQRGRREQQLMCRTHWRMVPSDLQDRVWSTWRAYQDAPLHTDDRGETVSAYIEAADLAVKSVTAKEIARQVPAGDASRCRSCGTAVVWTVTEAGRRMPVEPAPADGNVLLERQPDGALLAVMTRPGHGTHRSHFATCPQSESWRRT